MKQQTFRKLRLVLGDQLNLLHSWFSEPEKEKSETLYVLMEVMSEQAYVRHHVKKIVLFFRAMREFANALKSDGFNVVYIELDANDNAQSFPGNLRRLIKDYQVEIFEYQEPDEYRLDQLLRSFCDGLEIDTSCVSSEHFLTKRQELSDFFGGRKQWLMERFYREMRVRLNLLLDEQGAPLGGKWNFDAQNRKPPPKNLAFPEPPDFDNDFSEELALLESMDVPRFGEPDGFDFPVNRTQALRLLNDFVKNALPQFGDFQDAMTIRSPLLFHSGLSFAMNVKLLSPLEVIDAAISRYKEADSGVELAAVEGFVRQIIGWREYMRGIYWAKMPAYKESNFFEAKRPLPEWYWTGATGMNCLQRTIEDSLQNAYAHHIQRLMITGNFAALAGVAPDEINAWYLGIYADAVEWVQLPNTHGMSQYADGGLIATKPYVSSGNYINKMSDYCSGCQYNPNKKTEENACPFNALYWRFIDRNAEALADNPRMSLILANWRKRKPDDKKVLLEKARQTLSQIEYMRIKASKGFHNKSKAPSFALWKILKLRRQNSWRFTF